MAKKVKRRPSVKSVSVDDGESVEVEDGGPAQPAAGAVGFWQNPVKVGLGLGLPALLGGALLLRARGGGASSAEEQKRILREQLMANAQSQGGSSGFSAGDVNPMFSVPAGLCLIGLIYKCYKYKQTGKRKNEETMRTAMIIAGILSAFGVFLMAKPYLFPPPPKPEPSTFSLEFFNEMGAMQKNVIFGTLCAVGFGAYTFLNKRGGAGGGGGKHRSRHRHKGGGGKGG